MPPLDPVFTRWIIHFIVKVSWGGWEYLQCRVYHGIQARSAINNQILLVYYIFTLSFFIFISSFSSFFMFLLLSFNSLYSFPPFFYSLCSFFFPSILYIHFLVFFILYVLLLSFNSFYSFPRFLHSLCSFFFSLILYIQFLLFFILYVPSSFL